MAVTLSAKKAIRSSARKRLFNIARKRKMSEVIKKVRKLKLARKVEEARALLPLAYQAIDKAAKTKFIKKNKAARMKSRLVKFVNK
jgi:small subunit ribosomal protein S20